MALVRSRLVGFLHTHSVLSFALRALLGAAASCFGLAGCEATPDGLPPLPSDITLETADNYSVTIKLAIPELAMDPAAPVIDWTGVVNNLRGESVSPTDITLLTLARFDAASQTDITPLLESGEGVSSLADVAAKLVPAGGATAGSLAEFQYTTPPSMEGSVDVPGFFGVAGTYLLSFAKGTEQGQGTQSIVYLKSEVGATSATAPLAIPPGSGQLATYQPTLAPPVEVPANTAPGVLGWGNVQKDGQGLVIGAGYAKINRVFLAFHEGKTLADFNAKDTFLALEETAKLWQAPIAPPPAGQEANATRSIDLGSLKNDAGESFAQFDLAPGVWFFAAMCDNCNNPAMIVTALQPVGQ